jgi:hypothetical protein
MSEPVIHDFAAAAEHARQLRAEAAAACFARLVAFFRDTKECEDCGKPIVIS